MSALRWFFTRGLGRGSPMRPRPATTARLVLLLLSVAALGQEGCSSFGLNGSPCGSGSCGGLRSGCGPCSRLRNLFRRNNEVYYAPAPSIDYGTPPAAVVTPAPVTTTPGTVVPAPPGAIDQLEPLEPAPSATTIPPAAEPTPSSGTSLESKTQYEARRPAGRAAPGRGVNLAQALLAPTSPEPAPRPARRAAPARPAPSEYASLDNLPPLSLPIAPPAEEVVAVPARAEVPPVATITPEESPPAEPAPAPESAPSPGPPVETTAFPGIAHFKSVEPGVAGGSLPSVVGLNWLGEKGYKTILDLREPGPDQPSFIVEATRRGFRYLSLPVTADTIDAETVRRFNEELEQAESHPLYFCDLTGDRAGALYYIRRQTVDAVKIDAKTASLDATELGLTDKTFWIAATSYLDRIGAGKAAEPPKLPEPPPAAPAPGPAAPQPAPAPPPERTTSTAPEPPPRLRDPSAWKPFAALLVTGLAVPLAFWGRSCLSLGIRGRASLPAPARRVRSLPGASGE